MVSRGRLSVVTRHWRSAVSLVLVSVIVAAAALSRTSAAHRVSSSLGIDVQRQPYTALAFTRPAEVGDVGVRYRGKQVRDRVSFRIANREHRDIRYRWTITFRPSGRSYEGTATVGAGASAVVVHTVRLPCGTPTTGAGGGRPGRPPHRAQVQVRLRPSADRIDYWQACGG
jgi:hypothetical protein